MSKRVGLLAGLLVLALGPGAVAQERSPGPAAGGERIERAEDGFAVTVPEGWDTVDLPPEVGAEQGEVELEDGSLASVRFIVVALRPGSDELCLVTDFSTVADASMWTSVDAAVAFRSTMLDDLSDIGPFTTSIIDLPAGRTGRLDTTIEGLVNSRYYFRDEGSWFSLSCDASDPPEDRWLSIAETFEFLPEE